MDRYTVFMGWNTRPYQFSWQPMGLNPNQNPYKAILKMLKSSL